MCLPASHPLRNKRMDRRQRRIHYLLEWMIAWCRNLEVSIRCQPRMYSNISDFASAFDRFPGSYRVFIAPNGIIYDALLSMTNAGENNNKFYRIQLLVSTTGIYKTWTRWSRVGDIGQTKALGDGTLQSALFEYNKKFKEKAGLQWDNRLDPPKSKKYTFLERNYDGGEAKDSDDDHKDDAEGKYDDQVLLGIATKDGGKGRTNGLPVVESKLPKPVQRLMEMIFNRQYFARTMEV